MHSNAQCWRRIPLRWSIRRPAALPESILTHCFNGSALPRMSKGKPSGAIRGLQIADAVASGKVELGLTFISEMLPNKARQIAGPLPADIQSPTVYVVAIPASSLHPEEARAFLAAVTSQSVWPVITKAGLIPAEK